MSQGAVPSLVGIKRQVVGYSLCLCIWGKRQCGLAAKICDDLSRGGVVLEAVVGEVAS